VPMILAGDEMGRSQQGNNNAYCQDNALNWIDWQASDNRVADLNAFVTLLLKLRRDFPVLGHRTYMHPPHRPESENIQWLNSDGREMREEHWQEHHNFVLGYLLTSPGDCGGRIAILVIFNNSNQAQKFQLPRYQPQPGEPHHRWHWLVDTNRETGVPEREPAEHGEELQIGERSIAILSCGNKVSGNEDGKQ